MLDVCLIGTGGTVPLPERWLTSLLLRCDGKCILIDCGEGTQIAMHAQSLSIRQIDLILFTHYHADHTAGLPGLLLSMAKADRTEPLLIGGPKGLDELLTAVQAFAKWLPFDVRYFEYEEDEVSFSLGRMDVTAFAVKHSVTCYAYQVDVKRSPAFDREKAEAFEIPVRYWGTLQKGNSVEIDGVTWTPDMVLGQARKGIRLVYATDTRPVASIARHAENADLLIAEGMYGDHEKDDKAKKNLHMTMYEAAAIAEKAQVRQLWFTHYSPSEYHPEDYAEEVGRIFENIRISRDGERTDLCFTDE